MIRNLVIVGIDGTNALAAMEWAADYARMIDAKLRAVYVQPAEPPHRRPAHPMSATPNDEIDQEIRSIFYSVRPEPDWILATTRGSTGEVLVDTAKHAVALVVGSRQLTGLNAVLNHSISHYCALHARVPVVICPNIDEIAAHRADAHLPVSGTIRSPTKISIRDHLNQCGDPA